MSAFAEGHRIGPYRIVRLLGEGGMGVVYEAVREDLGGRIALKVLRVEYAIKPEFAARFFNEARAANVIEHPGVARVFDYGQLPGGVAYLAMEFLDGESLAKRLERLRKFTTEETLRVGRQIASAVASAHAKQIVHRDLKPENIMLVPDVESPGGDRVKVLDFGIAKLATELYGSAQTQTNVLIGTPIYMAPEQCRGTKGVGDKTDVYALGVILYEMLAGRTPFVGEEPGEYIGMHIFKEPPPLQQFAPNVPVPLLSLVHAMLTKVYEQRPDMAEVAQELKRLGQVHSESISAVSAPKPSPEGANNKLLIPSNQPSSPKLFEHSAPLQTVRHLKPIPVIAGLQSLHVPSPNPSPRPPEPALENPLDQKPPRPLGSQKGESHQPGLGPNSLDEATRLNEPPTRLQLSSMLDGPTEVNEPRTLLGGVPLNTPIPLPKNSQVPERNTAQTQGQIPLWLKWIKDHLAKGTSQLKSIARIVGAWLSVRYSGSSASTKVVWGRNSSSRRGLLLGMLTAGAMGLLLTWLAFRSPPKLHVKPAPTIAPQPAPQPVLSPKEIPPVVIQPPIDPPVGDPVKGKKSKDADGKEAKVSPRTSPRGPKAPTPMWTSQEVSRALSVARSKASQGDMSGALTTAHHAAEFGNEPASWAMVGVYACTLRNLPKANEALTQLSRKPGTVELLASLLSACRSQGIARGRDGRLALTIH